MYIRVMDTTAEVPVTAAAGSFGEGQPHGLHPNHIHCQVNGGSTVRLHPHGGGGT